MESIHSNSGPVLKVRKRNGRTYFYAVKTVLFDGKNLAAYGYRYRPTKATSYGQEPVYIDVRQVVATYPHGYTGRKEQ
jgi:hypothetical protein